jgi:hypothetical protein
MLISSIIQSQNKCRRYHVINATPTSFTLDAAANTSVGVYNSNDELVRTLWSNVQKDAGEHRLYWDGKNDVGNTAPIFDTYYFKLLTNNVTYECEGARIGNTSTALTGNTIHRASGQPLGMCIAAGKMYYASGYQEKYVANFVTSLTDIGSRGRVDGGGNNVAPMAVCTDGTTVFWGAYNSGGGGPFTFVYATKVTDGSVQTFTNGVVRTTSDKSYPSAISIVNTTGSDIVSMAVQVTGNKLFIGRAGQIKVHNKITGDLLQTLTVSGNPIMNVDGSDNLWLGRGNTVIKYTVNTDGTISTTGITLTGVLDVSAIAVSPDNNTVAIADQDTTQQIIKFYSNSSGGAVVNTLGTAGGYMTNATVTDYKFYFKDLRAPYPTSIAYAADGSIWMIDPGNNRFMHYSSSRVYIERIMYMGTVYSCQVDPNNKNRLFYFQGGSGTTQAGYFEFAIDYTKPLDNGVNGSWTLVKNWGAQISNTYDRGTKLVNILTLSGRTYARARVFGTTNFDVFELVGGGVARKTKVQFNTGTIVIAKDGTKYYSEGNISNSHIYKYTYTGLDSDNDPTWSATAQLVLTMPTKTGSFVDFTDDFRENVSSTGKWIFYDRLAKISSTGIDPHLGAIPTNGTNYQWKTSYGTLRGYGGDFPANGMFDNGNSVGGSSGNSGSAGGFSEVNGRNVLSSYHGEFWKTWQTNMFNHYLDNGLMVGQFGTLRTEYQDAESPLGGAGNALTGSWVQYSDDVAYFFHADEGVNAGATRWKISGLTSITEEDIPYSFSLNTPVTTEGLDLMADITGKGTPSATTGRWFFSETTNINNSSIAWLVFKGSRTTALSGGQDVYVQKSYQPVGTGGTKFVTCDLGANSGLNNWRVGGKIIFGAQNNFRSDKCYFQILDAAGKVIINFQAYTPGGQTVDIIGNDVTVHEFIDKLAVSHDQPFEISNNNGTITFKFMTYAATTLNKVDAAALITSPTTIRLLFEQGPNDKAMGVSELRFYNS